MVQLLKFKDCESKKAIPYQLLKKINSVQHLGKPKTFLKNNFMEKSMQMDQSLQTNLK
jgi:hypothetical protein